MIFGQIAFAVICGIDGIDFINILQFGLLKTGFAHKLRNQAIFKSVLFAIFCGTNFQIRFFSSSFRQSLVILSLSLEMITNSLQLVYRLPLLPTKWHLNFSFKRRSNRATSNWAQAGENGTHSNDGEL